MKKVLIPNRGEIAARIIRAAHELGLETVATLSELEKNTLPAQLSDEVHYFKEGPFEDNYLNIPLIIELAKKYQADCIHPGYGFLAENHLLAEACNKANILFIGPSSDNLKMMGDKQMARSIADKAKVQLTQSWEGSIQNILSQAETLPYPVLVKAAMGGGGKGIQICHSKDELLKQLPVLSKQAQRYFGDERIYVEQYIAKARHIEVQVLADKHGNTLHLYERECSAQRRFQKIIEEAPAPNLSNGVKQRLYADAISLCEEIGYSSAGTIEFLVDENGQHFFLEMNTRIQVEHCITEEITGIDLVKWQFKIAQGSVIIFKQTDLRINGHAIELRICAEDPANNFRPSPGVIRSLVLPSTKHVRIETGFNEALEIHSQFDPMIAKLIVHDTNREKAIEKAIAANRQFIAIGIKTNGLFIDQLLNHSEYKKAAIHTLFCEENLHELSNSKHNDRFKPALAYVVYRFAKLKNHFWRQLIQFEFKIDDTSFIAELVQKDKQLEIILNNNAFQVKILAAKGHSLLLKIESVDYQFYCFENDDQVEIVHQLKTVAIKAKDWLPDYHPETEENTKNNGHQFLAPIPSQVMKINVKDGQEVKKGDLLMVLEAMKTENHIKAWKDGVIDKIHINTGDQVRLNQTLLAYRTKEKA